jgi:hypothetical protein
MQKRYKSDALKPQFKVDANGAIVYNRNKSTCYKNFLNKSRNRIQEPDSISYKLCVYIHFFM